MKIIYKIAKMELSRLFYSPIAWLLLVVFCLQTGFRFMGHMNSIASETDAGADLSNLTANMFSSPFALWGYVRSNLYYFIPLLTMGLFSSERSNGSIKLLFSSPVKFNQIVFGKFLAVATYAALLMLILIVFTVAGGIAIKQLDYPLALTGVLGLFLLSCAYASIGLYISSLTSYQIVAAIGTLAVLTLLNLLTGFGQTIPVLNDIMYWISISSHVDSFIYGIINSRDLIYLISIVILFLSLTILKLTTEKKVFSKAFIWAMYISIVLGFCSLIYVFSKPTLMLYKDMTATKQNTLTPNSQQIASKVKDLGVMTTYVNILDDHGFFCSPAFQIRDKQSFSMFTRFLPHIQNRYVYYYDTLPKSWSIRHHAGKPLEEIAKKIAKSQNIDFNDVLSPEEIKSLIDLSSNENYMVREIVYNGQKAYIRWYDDMLRYASENEISTALKSLVEEQPIVGVLSANNEKAIYSKGDNGYRMSLVDPRYREALISKGFIIKELDSDDFSNLKGVDILLIADPGMAYTVEQLSHIINYLEDGGNAFLAFDADSYPYVQPLLDYLKIDVASGTFIQHHKDFPPDFILGQLGEDLGESQHKFHGLITNTKVSMPSAMGLRFMANTDFNVYPVVLAPEKTTKRVSFSAESPVKADTFLLEEPAFLMFAMSKRYAKKEQRIIVSGDANFMTNQEFTRKNVDNLINSQMVKPLFSWLCYDEFPIDTDRPPLKDTQYVLGENGLEQYRLLLNALFPAIMLGWGSILLYRRKRR